MIDFLLPEALLEKAHDDIQSTDRIELGIEVTRLDDEMRRALEYYRLFDEDIRSRSGLSSLSNEEAFYNQYYWYLVFAKLYQRSFGFDAGIEQQSFRLLESAPNGVSWERIEQIANSVGK